MSSIKISSLPLKRILSPGDIFTLVDTQRGPGNYVSKRTTMADIARFVQSSAYSGDLTLDGGRFPFVTNTYLTDESFCRLQLLTETPGKGVPIMLE